MDMGFLAAPPAAFSMLLLSMPDMLPAAHTCDPHTVIMLNITAAKVNIFVRLIIMIDSSSLDLRYSISGHDYFAEHPRIHVE
jgi:hypothetical protein